MERFLKRHQGRHSGSITGGLIVFCFEGFCVRSAIIYRVGRTYSRSPHPERLRGDEYRLKFRQNDPALMVA